MRHQSLFALIFLAVPTAAFAQEGEAKAVAQAKEILDKGATLFDKRDASAIAATYIESAQLILIKRASDTDRFVTETRSSRVDIERAYADIFKDRQPEHKCRNTVESARFLGTDTLLISGRFALNVDNGDSIQFVQVRVKEGDDWKIATLQMMELPK